MALYNASSVFQCYKLSGKHVGDFSKIIPLDGLAGGFRLSRNKCLRKILIRFISSDCFFKKSGLGKNLDLIWFTYGLSCTCQKTSQTCCRCIMTLFRKNKRFAINKMFQRNTSKFSTLLLPL